MKIEEMSIKEMIIAVKQLDKELSMEIWHDAFGFFEYGNVYDTYNLDDVINDWDNELHDWDNMQNYNSADYTDMAYKALKQEDYPVEYKEHKEDIRNFFEVVLEKIEESMYDKELEECTNKVMRLIDFRLKRKGTITEDDKVYLTITDKTIMTIIKREQKDNIIIYHFDRLNLFMLGLSVFYRVKDLINRDEKLTLTRVYDKNGKTCIEVKREK